MTNAAKEVRRGERADRSRTASNDFGLQVHAEIPRLRRYARALTRDSVRADDLVQNCIVRAIAKQHLWQPGTDLRAWLFTILHNQHVNDIRQTVREGAQVSFEDMEPVLTAKERATSALQLRDLQRAIAQLPAEQHQVILLVGLEALTYEEVASIVEVPIGTVRSRLSRGRNNLRRLMGLDAHHTTAHSRTVDEEIMPDREFEPALSGAVLPSFE